MRFLTRIIQCNKLNVQNSFNYTKNVWLCTKYENDLKKPEEKRQESPLKGMLEDAVSFADAKPSSEEQRWATLPYPRGVKVRKQGAYGRPRRDPRDTTVIMFPGQGHQHVGMAKDLLKFPMARDLFDLANYVLG